jgi:hypothetical protein
MARAALKLGVRELAQIANVSTNTITRFEQDEPLRPRTVWAIKSALEQSGIVFIAHDRSGGPGVRLASWYSEALLPAMKLGFRPPKLAIVSDNSIDLESSDRLNRILIKVDRACLVREFGHLVDDDRRVEDIIMINLATITRLASQKYLNREYTIHSIRGERVLQIELGMREFEHEIFVFQLFTDEETLFRDEKTTES